jgi:RHS repeat-associated protein
MSAGGEEKAVFVGLKNDAQEYLPQAAHKAAQFAEDTSHTVDQGVTAHLEGDAQLGRDMTHIGEHPPEEVPRVQSQAAPPRGRGVSSQAESDAKNLAAETDKEAQEGARLDGEGGSSEDPIDLVSGEMFLPQTDLVLPGELPLVLERRHGSAYRYGRFFGSTWSSTLDQRLEIDDDGIHVALADGRVLHYPVPTVPGQQVMPSHGPRWPLSWNRAGDEIILVQGETGTTLHFPPGPTPEICRPLASMTDRSGYRITFVHDADGVPTDVYHSGGYHVLVESTETRDGVRVSALKLADPAGGHDIPVRAFRYDLAGRLTGVVNSSHQPLVFAYDEADRITAWTDRNGYSYRYFYGQDGRVERAEGDGGILDVALNYDLTARTTTMTDALGNASVYYWNERAQTVKVADPLGRETLTEQDRYGQVTRITDPLGQTTSIARDGFGDALLVSRPDGTTVTTAYNEQRQPVSVTGPDGAQWRYEYDQAGTLAAVDAPGEIRIEYRRDHDARTLEYRDPLGRATRILHDRAGLPIEFTDASGAITLLKRDAFGRVVEIADPLGARTELTWNVDGKPLTRARPGGGRETWSYDAEGNLLAYTDPAGATTRYEYGPFDAVTARTEPGGGRFEFGYDRTLNLTSVTAPTGLVWSYEYDACGNLIRETDFNGAAQTYTLDAAGQLVERVNAVGQATRTTYDLMGRITSRTAGDSQYLYAYDPAGQVVRAEGPGSLVEFTRDEAGRVVAETVNGRTVASVYDPVGQRIERTTPAGVVSRWTFDETGLPVALAGTAGALSFEHDEAGRETTRYLGPAASLTSTYDELGRVSGQGVWRLDQPGASDRSASQARWRALQARSYTYRADGTPTRIEDQLRGTRAFELDVAGRVTGVDAGTSRETYAYDALGNLTDSAIPSAEPDSEGTREITGTLTRRAGRTRYEHDAAGRLVRRIRATLSGQIKEWSYTWDADDRLTEATTPDGTRWSYSYDALGRRIAKTVQEAGAEPRSTVYFVWDGPRLVEEIRVDGGRTTATTWDHDPGTFKPAAQTRRSWVDGATAEQIDQEFHAIVADLVGTPTELVTPDGRIAWRGQSSLWGQTTSVPGSTTDCPLRFPGQYHDDETGLDYSYFRYYSPEDAAFLTADPLGITPAPNPHAYVLNPLTWSDPLGLAGCPVTVTVKWEEGMPKSQFKLKADALQRLSDDGKLFKAPNPVARDRQLTRNYRSDLIKRIYNQFHDVNPDLSDSLIERVRGMDPDHVWELQLGGPDVTSNLHILDRFTNQRIGIGQIWPQIRGLADHTPIRIRIEGPPS